MRQAKQSRNFKIMPEENRPETNHKNRKSIIEIIVSKRDPDTAYFSDLQNQWSKMDAKNRILFVVGGLTGFILFLAMLFLFFFLLYQLLG